MPHRGLHMQGGLDAAAMSKDQVESEQLKSDQAGIDSETKVQDVTKTDVPILVEASEPTVPDGVQDRELSPSDDPYDTTGIITPATFV